MRILAVEDEDNWRKVLKNSFRNPQYELQLTDDIDEAESVIDREIKPDIAIVNLNLVQNIHTDKSGKLILGYIQDNYPYIPRIVISGIGFSARDIMDQFGVYDVLSKPFEIDDLITKMNHAITERKKSKGMKVQNQKTVFISYAKEDYNIAKKLYNDLVKNGITPWLDREDLLPGQNWKITIPKIIRNSSHVLFLISENSVSKRGFVQKELKIALDVLDECPSDQIFIIPVRLDRTEPIDDRLKDIQWADLSDYEKGLKQILKTLRTDYQIQIEEYKKQTGQQETDKPVKGDKMILEHL